MDAEPVYLSLPRRNIFLVVVGCGRIVFDSLRLEVADAVKIVLELCFLMVAGGGKGRRCPMKPISAMVVALQRWAASVDDDAQGRCWHSARGWAYLYELGAPPRRPNLFVCFRSATMALPVAIRCRTPLSCCGVGRLATTRRKS